MSDRVLSEAESWFPEDVVYCPRYRVSFWSRTQTRVATRSFRLLLDYVFVSEEVATELDRQLAGIGRRLGRSTTVFGSPLQISDEDVGVLQQLQHSGEWDIAPSRNRRELARGMVGHRVNVAVGMGRQVTGEVTGVSGTRVLVQVDGMTGLMKIKLDKLEVAHG